MSESIYRIELHEKSESHYFLPRPPYFDALYYLTSMAHEYPLPSYYVERFQTDVYMVNYTLKGQGRFVYDETSYTLKEGTLLFAYLGVHNVLFPLTDDFEYCCFHINGAQIKNIYNHATENGKKITVQYPCEAIMSLFEKLRTELVPPIDFFEISKELGSLLTDILRCSVSETKTMSPLMHEVYKLILNNNTSVKDISKKLNFSPIYLEKLFKEETGESIRSMIVKHKLEQAQNLLLSTTLSVNDIARQVGYSDTVGLIHLFRRHLDCTPHEFRKQRRSAFYNKNT